MMSNRGSKFKNAKHYLDKKVVPLKFHLSGLYTLGITHDLRTRSLSSVKCFVLSRKW